MTTQTKTTWQKVKLGDAVDIIDGDRGKNYPSKEEFSNSGYCVFLDAKNVSGAEFDFSNAQFITKERDQLLRKGKLSRDDFVLTTRGTVGNVAYYGKDVNFDNIRINSGMVILRPKRNIIEEKFFNLYLISQEFKNQIEALKSGSAQPQLPIRDLKLFEINLPSAEEQKYIVSILWPIKNKVELNNKISRTLEQMAQAIFKEWFIENEKSKVKSEKLEAVCDIVYGKDLPTRNLKKYGSPVYGGNGIIGYSDKYLYSEPQIIIGCRGAYSGNIFKTEPKSFITHNSLVLKIKGGQNIGINYLFHALQKSNVRSSITGSAQPQITIAELNQVPIPISDENLMREFENMASVIENYKFKVINENQKLAALRDLLLPKLMNGEIKV